MHLGDGMRQSRPGSGSGMADEAEADRLAEAWGIRAEGRCPMTSLSLSLTKTVCFRENETETCVGPEWVQTTCTMGH